MKPQTLFNLSNTQTGFSLLSFLAGGILIGSLAMAAMYFLSPKLGDHAAMEQSNASDEKKPLYWVAPMDANYRRDEPGLSPMGMELIPVYEDEGGLAEDGPGAISISPSVENNLGVRTAPVVLDTLHTEISTVGYVQYDEDQLIHLHPRVEGWIETLHVKASGDPIKKGQPIYALYSPQLINAQEELLLALSRKNSRLIKAAEDRLMALNLNSSFIQQLKRTKQVRQTITFYAAQDGIVDNLNIREGFFVQPGTTLMSIGVLDEVWVRAEIFERQAPFVKAGQPVTMQLDYLPGREWQGHVDYIYPTLDAKTRTIRVRMRFDNHDQVLKPNMFAQVQIHADSEQPVLLIPKEALIRTGHQDRVVLALGEGRFKSLEVTLGRVDDRSAEILEGLNPNDRVVTSAQFLLDSESSKTSDFKRMMPIKEYPRARVKGVINTLDKQQLVANISREAIEKWQRPATTMDFSLSHRLSLAALNAGDTIEFVFEVRDGNFVIVDISPDYQNPDIQNKDSKMIEGH
jgi:Cu(I)/Ag(I) efflux system membrane fusion protein